MRITVDLFATCIVDAIYPAVGEAVVDVLERCGHTVEFPRGQVCCGLPFYNNGYRSQACAVARGTVRAFAKSNAPVIVPSGSCAWMMRKIYPELLGEEGSALAARVFEFSEFVAERTTYSSVPRRSLASPVRLTYHPSCHLSRGLRIDRPPRRLMESLGATMVPLQNEAECCGFGGAFAIRYGGISSRMLEDKLGCAADTAARTLVVTDPGCQLQLDCGARRNNCSFAVRHLAEVLADSDARG